MLLSSNIRSFSILSPAAIAHISFLDVGALSIIAYLSSSNTFSKSANISVFLNGTLTCLCRSPMLRIFFTTAGVIAENSGWASCLRDNQVLNSYTKEDFRNNGGSITLTAFDNSGPEATVSFNESSNILCGNCGRATVSLSSGSNMVHACVSFSETSNTADFGLIVRTVAFPQIFTLITNECCLGWSSRNFNSFTTEKNIYWKYYSKFEEIIK